MRRERSRTGNPTAVIPVPPAPAPTLTRMVSGTVGEVDRGPIAGAKVTTAYTPSTFTDSTGAFSVAYPAAVLLNVLTVDAPGFDSRQFGWSAGSANVTLGTIRLQRTILLAEMSSLTGILSPNDLPSYVGDAYDSDYCSPCKPLRLRVGAKLNVRVNLKWSGGTALQLWAWVWINNEGVADAISAVATPGQSELVLTVPVRPGDTRLWVGLPPLNRSIQHLEAPVSFEVTTHPAAP